MRSRDLLLTAAFSCLVGTASADCGLHLHGGHLPSLTGRVVFQACDTVDCDSSSTLQLFDFSTGTGATIDTASAGLLLPLNPAFQPDGSAIVFSALSTAAPDARQLYYWKIGSSEFIPLTGPQNLRNEDPKFSPDGAHLVWKQHYGLETADFSLTAQGNPRLTNLRRIVFGKRNALSEASAPVYSFDQQRIYYYSGSKSNAPRYPKLEQYVEGSGSSLVFTQQRNIQYYYPADMGPENLLYVSWLTAHNKNDKVFVYSKTNDTNTTFNGHDCQAGNSDPAPIDNDYFLFSRLGPDAGDRDVFYLGQVSTGFVRSLDTFSINTASGFLLGANYSNARPPQRGGLARR